MMAFVVRFGNHKSDVKGPATLLPQVCPALMHHWRTYICSKPLTVGVTCACGAWTQLGSDESPAPPAQPLNPHAAELDLAAQAAKSENGNRFPADLPGLSPVRRD